MSRSLFDRIFTYPASSTVLPSENLATEIVAYFLEAWPPFRRHYLKAVGIEDAGDDWKVDTQFHLYAPSCAWHGRIPDLRLQSAEASTLVLTEVKIDAGVTFRDEIAQTKHYYEYLEQERELGRIKDYRLVLLTRWAPERELLVQGAKSIRFGDIAKWLDECIRSAVDHNDPQAELARQWVGFLRRKRWVMPEITPNHVDAIKFMGELLPQLWEVLSAARQSIIAEDREWSKMRGRATDAHLFGGSVIWEAPLCLARKPECQAQLGFFYGEDHGDTALYPLIWFNNALGIFESDSNQIDVRPDGYGHQAVFLSNLVPSIRRGLQSEVVWDAAKSQLIAAIERLKPIPPILPTTDSIPG